MAVSKTRISATIDPENAEFLEQSHINASGLINELLTQYRTGGGSEDIIREYRIQQLESEAEDHRNQAERKLEQAKRLREAETEQTVNELERVLDKAEMIPADPEHPFVRDNADALDMTPVDLAQKIADTHNKEYQDPTDSDSGLRSI